MSVAIAYARRRGTGLLVVPAAVVIIALAFAIGRAEASGDEYGDSTDSSGGIAGDESNATGAADTDIVQVGTVDSSGVGSLTVFFDDNVAFNGTGDDIIVRTIDVEFPAEATIEVSADGVTWVAVGDFFDTADVSFDIGGLGLDYAVAVRITNLTTDAALLPGFDVESVEALNQIDLEDVVLDATPDTDENPGLTSHTVTANLKDAGVAVEGALVSFLVSPGPNDLDAGSEFSDAAGDAAFTYTGDGGPGVDAITAWLDINGNGTLDAGEPSDVVSKQWHGVTGTIDLTDVDGGGVVVGDTLQVFVDDKDLDTTAGADTVTVMVSSTSDPAPGGLTALLLTETGPSTGVFVGSLTLVDTATNEATAELLAADGDTITASYDDALDGNGDDPPAVTDTLTVTDVEDFDGAEKVTICHYPGGNPGNAHTLSVGAPAVDSHLANHGDDPGECLDVGEDADGDDKLAAFCERKPGHPRCDDAASPGASAQGASQQGDDVDLDGEDDDEDSAEQLAAFCERKPDHRRCEALAE
jgi:hypothetical protein